MTLTRKWSASFQSLSITFECPFFDEFVDPKGALNRDFEAHALWHYYGAALQAYKRARDNLVEESELSIIFNVDKARMLFLSISRQHDVRPDKMVNYWPMIHRNRISMGGQDHLPEEFQFHYWGN